MVTDIMDDENILTLGRILAERNEGFIQMTYAPDKAGDIEGDSKPKSRNSTRTWRKSAAGPFFTMWSPPMTNFPGATAGS